MKNIILKQRVQARADLMSISRCGQEVLERSACEIDAVGNYSQISCGISGIWKDDSGQRA